VSDLILLLRVTAIMFSVWLVLYMTTVSAPCEPCMSCWSANCPKSTFICNPDQPKNWLINWSIDYVSLLFRETGPPDCRIVDRFKREADVSTSGTSQSSLQISHHLPHGSGFPRVEAWNHRGLALVHRSERQYVLWVHSGYRDQWRSRTTVWTSAD